jgi:hypothetical protein
VRVDALTFAFVVHASGSLEIDIAFIMLFVALVGSLCVRVAGERTGSVRGLPEAACL